eukprot:GFYU01027005.1.p1 GENE.GFYU01027005.1~~GFYU01027005.1.p1  ORF type:complete len:247 (-),score=64.55 GFYU01027005.1:90-758(-)
MQMKIEELTDVLNEMQGKLNIPDDTPETDPEVDPGMKGMTDAHNNHRTTNGLDKLKWSSSIANDAQQWANMLKSRRCTILPFPEDKAKTKGINVAVVKGTELSSEAVVNQWYSEEDNWQDDSKSCKPTKVCKHYLQVMSKTSKEVGCGYSLCGDTMVWVCLYQPPLSPKEFSDEGEPIPEVAASKTNATASGNTTAAANTTTKPPGGKTDNSTTAGNPAVGP